VTDRRPGEDLPREKVLAHLADKAPQIVVPYLEHVVTELGEKGELFHNELLYRYFDRVIELQDKHSPRKKSTTNLVINF